MNNINFDFYYNSKCEFDKNDESIICIMNKISMIFLDDENKNIFKQLYLNMTDDDVRRTILVYDCKKTIINEQKNSCEQDEFVFICACLSGNLLIAKSIHANKPNINISANNDYAFRIACENGHLEVAQWLYEIKKEINIEIAFIFACENGHLDIAQWLLEIKPSIKNLDDYVTAFENACENAKLDVAKWLFEVNPCDDMHKVNNFIRNESLNNVTYLNKKMKKLNYETEHVKNQIKLLEWMNSL